jgi:sugar/nucleoside kinase (ribokinase family)
MTAIEPELDVVCLGEVLVDLVPLSSDSTRFLARPGGAPANVAAALAALNQRTAIVSRVGSDAFGSLLVQALGARGVATHLLAQDSAAPTGLSVVSPHDSDYAPFVLYRHGSADSAITVHESWLRAVRETRILHLGSLLLTSVAGRTAFAEAVAAARQGGALISSDVNLRSTAWPDAEAMATAARDLIAAADIVKVTKDELATLQIDDNELHSTGKLWLVTDGPKGATIVLGDAAFHEPAPVVPFVDSTGAGDASLAAVLYSLLSAGVSRLDQLTAEDLRIALQRAVRAGSHVVQVAGAMEGLLTEQELTV